MKTNQSEKKKEFEHGVFQQMLFKYTPYWYIFLIFILLSLTAGFLFLKWKAPSYQTIASLLIKDERKGLEDSKIEEVLNLFGTKNIVENEVEIIRSNAALREVGRKLKMYAQVYEVYGWRNLIQRTGFESCPLIVEVEDPEQIKGKLKPATFQVSADFKTVLMDGKSYPLNQFHKTPYGNIRFTINPNFSLKSKQIASEKSYGFALISLDEMVTKIGQQLTTKLNSKQTSVVSMSFTDESPKRGEIFLTELVAEYNTSNIRKKNQIAQSTLKFIQAKINNLTAELDSVENSIQKYRSREGIVNIGEQGKQYLQSIQENDQELNKLNVQSVVLDEVQGYLNGRKDGSSMVPSTYNISDPNLSGMLDRLYNTEAEYEKLRRTTAENNPILQSTQNEIIKMKANINENVNNQRKSINAGKKYLSGVTNQYSSMLNTIPQKERKLVEVSRQLNTKNEIYAFLLQKKEEIEYSINSALPESFMVDLPESSTVPVSPKKFFVLILSLIIPLGLSLGVITIKESFNNKILYRSEIENLSSLPILGEVIYEKLDSNIVALNNQRSFFKEQFRQIRSSLRSFNKMQPKKRIVVTSSIQGEGKSLVATNLAISLANSGKKVALLELDLYQPKILTMFEMENQTGITDYLMNEAEYKQIIITSQIPNLSILSAGNLVDSPSEILLNGRIEELFTKLEAEFDILVIDTPPVRPITDAFEIARSCDLLLYVIRHNFTPKVHVQVLDEEVLSHDIKNVALIFNGIKRRGAGKHSYGYGYGYGYDDRVRYDDYGKKKSKKKLFA